MRISVVFALLAAVGGASAQSVQRPGVTVDVYLSDAGVGLLALPQQAVQAFADPVRAAANPIQTVAGVVGSVQGGANSMGWRMTGYLAGPSVVNLGALNLTWQSAAYSGRSLSPVGQAVGQQQPDYLGVKLGVLNTTAPILCDGVRRVLLQLDSGTMTRDVTLSRLGSSTAQMAARVEYVCT